MSTVDAKIIEHITNGSNSGGGSSTPEDVLTRFTAPQSSNIEDSDYRLLLSGNNMIKPSVVKLYNKNTQTIDTLYLTMFIREIYPSGDTTTANNAVEVEETTKDVQTPRENRDRGFEDRRREFNKNQQ